ncbi:MAG: anhydro-N-acetylmuramic acid kinase [Balneolaceae bacterium]|nr:anhydro-N-acetylmuramic acid kinase [Balneolaceae bacterium]
MNSSIEQIYKIASKHQKMIVGLMSGTSLDGLDIALCRITGTGKDTKLELEHFATVAYPDEVSNKLKSIVSVEEVSLKEVCLAHTWLGDYHADLVLERLHEWEIEPFDVDVIASHGQTLYHAPVIQHQQEGMPNATLQIADGDHIAKKTGILTVSDFRQKHTSAGGEGAPMVSFVDELLFRDTSSARVLVNIGGIANLTFLPPLESKRDSISGDTGPGNTLINSAVQKHFEKPFDEGGRLAAEGTINAELFKNLIAHPYLKKPFPKTTGPEEFNLSWVESIISENDIDIGKKDLTATLTWFTAQSLADAILEIAEDSEVEIYLSGGGINNQQLVDWLRDLLSDQKIYSFEEIGFNPDAKEAVSFAVLANELLSGDGFFMDPKQNIGRRVNFGKISLPV